VATVTRALAPLMCAVIVCSSSTSTVSTAASTVSRAPEFRIRTFAFVDRSRTIRLPNGRRVPRPVETIVRYPATHGPHPLIVFGHGFALTPGTYGHLLDAWAQAGYVVAAPLFPLGNADAPGGPDESDLANQPHDMSFVITRLLAQSGRAYGVLAGRINRSSVAIAGHSDGGVTALAVAYDRRSRDPRVRAAIVLSGAALPGWGLSRREGRRFSPCRGRPTRSMRPRRPPPFSVWRTGRSSYSG
jgi:alpha-beta hydrolase superfamily lysophospholipase